MREGKIYPTECRIPENKKEAVLCEQYKKIEENNRILKDEKDLNIQNREGKLLEAEEEIHEKKNSDKNEQTKQNLVKFWKNFNF